MHFKAVSLFALIFVVAGCNTSPVPQPTLTAVSSPSAPTATATTLLPGPVSTETQQGLAASLEVISPDNAARIVPIARIGEGTFVDHLAVSPDGNLLAISTEGGVLLVDASNGKRRSFLPSPTEVDSLAFSPDGMQIATIHRESGADVLSSGDLAGTPIYHPVLRLYEVLSGMMKYSLNLSERGCGEYAAWDLAFSPDGKTVAFRDEYSLIGHARTDNLCLLSAPDGTLLRSIPIEPPWRSTSPVVFTPDGSQLVISVVETSTQGQLFPVTRVRFFETSTGTLLRELDGQGILHDLALSPDGSTLALSDQSGARLLSVQNGSLLGYCGDHTREVFSVVFSPDGTQLALGSLDGTISIWSVSDNQKKWQSTAWKPYSILKTEDGTGEIWDLAFSTDGAIVFALAPTHQVDTSGQVSALQAADGQVLFQVAGTNPISTPVLSPDKTKVAFGGYEDGQVQVWSVAENQPLLTLLGHTGLVLSVVFSPSGEQVASASLDGTVRVWNTGDGATLLTLAGHSGPVRAVQFSPNGAQLASVGDDATLRLWDVMSSQLLKTLDTQTGDWLANSITYSPDGQQVFLAYGCPYASLCQGNGAGDLRQIDLNTGQVQTLIPYSVFAVAYSADQASFAIGGAQQIQSGQASGGQHLVQHTYLSPLGNGVLDGAALSPDGQLFFSGNAFGLHVWNAANGEMLALCKGISAAFGKMVVTPDQKVLIIASENGVVGFWGVLTQ